MSEEKLEVEFTDRYGDRMPSILRGCRGHCEATGWVPIESDETDEPWRTLWRLAEANEPSDDGWHFVKCPSCSGTGRVSWMRTITRIPWWIWLSGRQSWMFTMNPDYFIGDQGFWKRLGTSLYICFWLDIKRLRN